MNARIMGAWIFAAVMAAELVVTVVLSNNTLGLSGTVEGALDGLLVSCVVAPFYLLIRRLGLVGKPVLQRQDYGNAMLVFVSLIAFEWLLHPDLLAAGRSGDLLQVEVVNAVVLALVGAMIGGLAYSVDGIVERIRSDKGDSYDKSTLRDITGGILVFLISLSVGLACREFNHEMFAHETALAASVTQTVSRQSALVERAGRFAHLELDAADGRSYGFENAVSEAKAQQALTEELVAAYYKRNALETGLPDVQTMSRTWQRFQASAERVQRASDAQRAAATRDLQQVVEELSPQADRLLSAIAAVEAGRAAFRASPLIEALTGFLGVIAGFLILVPVFRVMAAHIQRVREALLRAVKVNSNLESYQRALDEHAIFAVTNAMGKIVQVNEPFLKACRYTREEVIGQAHRILHSGEHDNAFYEDMWRTIANKSVWRGEVCNRASDGTHFWVDLCITPLVGDDGKIERYVGISYDITQRKQSELMAERRQRLEKTIESMRAELLLQGSIYGMLPAVLSELNAITGAAASLVVELGRNRDGHAWGLMLGHARLAQTEDESLPRSQPLLVNGADMHPLIQEAVQQSEAFGGLSARELGSNSFTAFEINVGYEPIGVLLVSDLASRGSFDEYVKYVIASLTDLMSARRESDRRRSDEENQRRLAKRDPLTGLGNRRDLMEEFESRTDHPDATFAMMLIDLDRFKPINDTFGHLIGDTVLRVVSERLCALAKGDCTVARIGGDEFAILTEARLQTDDAAAMDLAGKIIAELGRPIVCDGHELSVGASVGVAMYPRDGRSFQVVLHCADAAMYRAKINRSEAQAFDVSMDEAIRQRAELETDLKRAIDDGDIVPHFQPYVDLKTGKVVGHEVLARWSHPTRGNVSPSVFVKIAEESGLVDRLFWLMLRTACKKHLDGNHDTILSVNLSPAQISNPLFANQLVDEIGRLKFPPHLLEIEITETSMVGDLERVRPLLLLLKGFGVQIALDDFGTGYSSLALLRSLPISKLKIDHSFTSDLESQDSSRGTLVNAILGIAKAMSLKVTAEGIEYPEVAAYLREHGCDFGQGYLYAKARPEISCAIDTDARVPLRKRA